MRYALISDIHGNLEALRAVVDAISKERIDAYLCAGDVVGYGADPEECIKLVRSLDPKVSIAGNHDWGVLALTDLDYFNQYARAAVKWTRDALRDEELEYLKSFRLVYQDRLYTLVHGSLEEPPKFNYIMYSDEASLTMKLADTSLCFVGHTHAAGIFYSEEGKVRYTIKPRMVIDYKEKYVINAGSVGQPRDGDPRASFAIYDEEAATVEIRRVPYDIESAQKKIIKAGLPAWLATRLPEGR